MLSEATPVHLLVTHFVLLWRKTFLQTRSHSEPSPHILKLKIKERRQTLQRGRQGIEVQRAAECRIPIGCSDQLGPCYFRCYALNITNISVLFYLLTRIGRHHKAQDADADRCRVPFWLTAKGGPFQSIKCRNQK